MITYSYKSFYKKDLKDINVWSADELAKFDNVNLTHLTSFQRSRLFVHYEDMYYDVLKTTGEYIPSIFKDICVKDTCSLFRDKYNLYFTYSLSDRDDTEEEDERVLECGVYEHDFDKDGTEKFNFVMTYKIKLQHVFSARNNFRKNINQIREMLAHGDDKSRINTYVIPIYLCTERDDPANYHYIRFSDYVLGDDSAYIHGLLEVMIISLTRYMFVNTFVWYNLNNRNSYHVSYDREVPYTTKKDVVSRQKLASKARSNKNLVICLDNAYNIDLVMNTRCKNMYSGASRKPCTISSYKFQVIGHYQHYWVGKGRRTRIKRWIDPYYKNVDEQFNIVKQYTKEDAPEE